MMKHLVLGTLIKRGFLFLLLSVLMGCASRQFSQVDMSTTGYLPASGITPVQVTVNHGVDTSEYVSLLYVNMRLHGVSNWAEYQDYVMQAVSHFGFFDRIVTRKPTSYINAPAMPATQIVNDQTWVDVENHIPVASLLNTYGPHFLILDVELYTANVSSLEGNTYFFQAKLIDPRSRRVLMQASAQQETWNGLDNKLINPVLNYVLGYLYFYDPRRPKPDPQPRDFGEWWERVSEDFIKTFYFSDPAPSAAKPDQP